MSPTGSDLRPARALGDGGAQWGAVRRGSGRLSTLWLAPAWPGPRGRKFSPAPAPSCPPSRSLLHNSPSTHHARRHREHLIPTSHSQMFSLLLRTPKLASRLGDPFSSVRQLRIPGSPAHVGPAGPWPQACRAPPQRHPAVSASSSATSKADKSPCLLPDTSRAYQVLVHA